MAWEDEKQKIFLLALPSNFIFICKLTLQNDLSAVPMRLARATDCMLLCTLLDFCNAAWLPVMPEMQIIQLSRI